MDVPPIVKQIRLLLQSWFSWRRLLFNRFTALLLLLLVVAIGGQVYVESNDEGIIDGTVVDCNGEPVSGATVIIESRYKADTKTLETETDQHGQFALNGYDVEGTPGIDFRTWAEKDGVGRSPRYLHHANYVGEPLTFEYRIDGSENGSCPQSGASR